MGNNSMEEIERRIITVFCSITRSNVALPNAQEKFLLVSGRQQMRAEELLLSLCTAPPL